MTIAQALKLFPDIEADILLAHVLKTDKEFLYIHSNKKLTAAVLNKYKALSQKRLNGLPIAYIVGFKYFYDLKFKVNKNVLVPRPETEWIVEETARIIKSRGKKRTKLIEVGTGSGCIAISISNTTENNLVDITATDISTKALTVAKANAKTHKAKIKFLKRNLLSGIATKFDIIIANLPYVPLSSYKKLRHNLKHEPKSALTDGTDQFILISKLIAQASKRLNKDGYLIIETDPLSIQTLTGTISLHMGKKNVLVIKDINNFQRFIVVH